MKQVDVTILGQGYVLACAEDGQESLLRAVAMVDREMSSIRDAGKIKARERIAVLAALNLAYRLAESQAQIQQLEQAQAARTVWQQPGLGAGEATGGARGSEGLNGDDGGDDGGEQARRSMEMQALIHRLDEVLAEDGRLL